MKKKDKRRLKLNFRIISWTNTEKKDKLNHQRDMDMQTPLHIYLLCHMRLIEKNEKAIEKQLRVYTSQNGKKL